MFEKGTPIVPAEVETKIDQNKSEYAKENKFLISSPYSGNRIKETISEIDQIIDVCKKNDIELTVFIHPMNVNILLSTNFENFQKFKFELSQRTNFYDFSGINDITKNNYNYYDVSHYRKFVGKMVAERLKSKSSTNQKKQFGYWVSKNNVSEHLLFQKKEYDQYKKDLP